MILNLAQEKIGECSVFFAFLLVCVFVALAGEDGGHIAVGEVYVGAVVGVLGYEDITFSIVAVETRIDE